MSALKRLELLGDKFVGLVLNQKHIRFQDGFINVCNEK
jgi:dsRNA-specific ribonuclease